MLSDLCGGFLYGSCLRVFVEQVMVKGIGFFVSDEENGRD